MKWSLVPVLCAALCATLPAACTSLGDVPAAQAVLSEGTPTRLGVPVRVGAVVVTPLEVVEDSRCPINARCVWAGRLIVDFIFIAFLIIKKNCGDSSRIVSFTNSNLLYRHG